MPEGTLVEMVIITSQEEDNKRSNKKKIYIYISFCPIFGALVVQLLSWTKLTFADEELYKPMGTIRHQNQNETF